jgi:hypothetical protein
MTHKYLLVVWVLLLTVIAATAQPTLPPLPTDTDGDSVLDSLDQCPDKAGCPEILGCPCVMVPDTAFRFPPTKMYSYHPPVFKTTQQSVLVEDSIPHAGKYIKLEDSVRILLYEYSTRQAVIPICGTSISSKYCSAIYCDGTKIYTNTTFAVPVLGAKTFNETLIKNPKYKVLKYIRYVKDPNGEYMNEQPAKYEQIGIAELVKESEWTYQMSPPRFKIFQRAECLKE